VARARARTGQPAAVMNRSNVTLRGPRAFLVARAWRACAKQRKSCHGMFELYYREEYT
jgi:hypothetical protein